MLTVGLALLLTFGLTACSKKTTNDTEVKAPEQNQSTTGEIDKNDKSPFKVTMAGGSVGGFWAALGPVVGNAFLKSYPATSFSYEPGSGAGNIKLLSEGKVELGIVQSVEVIAAQKGLDPFQKKYDDLRAFATLYDNAVLQIAVRKEFVDKTGAKGFEDIVKNKIPANIGINQKGNLNSLAGNDVLKSYGITEENLKSWGGSLIWQGSATRFDAVKNGRLDITLDFTFAPEAKITETSVNTPLVMWSINDAAAKKLKQDWDLKSAVIPKGTYEWQKEDVNTVTLSAVILAGSKATKQDLYKMAKALTENIDLIKNVHPSMKEMTPEKLANTGVLPLAPGAEDYFKEAGLIK
ncbi:MAG: hypothetical protein VR66_27145 [Peptococcaceae bacterium BRH_c23]|nr:MAG: hypothetical protein VR66_27145 [Peptococcaceae bacterium BRH_c23]KJS83722.1 MAG: hypothetical protein JL57_22310 [Desulfosporosinus sp. BICA1-9]